MKNTSSMIILLLGFLGCGYLYAHQPDKPWNYRDSETGANIQVSEKHDPMIKNLSDTSHTEPFAGDDTMKDNIRDRLADAFKELDDFSIRFNDSSLFQERFKEFFDDEFQQKLEHLRSDVFNEQFIKRLQERLKDFHEKDSKFELNKDFRQYLLEKLEKMSEKLEELDQQFLEKSGRGKAI